MKSRVVWLLLAPVLLSFFLILASCGAAASTTASASAPKTTTTPPKSVAPNATTAAVATPKYGGDLTVILGSTVIQFDEGQNATMTVTTGGFTHNEPAVGDWAKGPAGTGEADWTYSGNDRLRLKTGAVVQSWDVPEAGHLIFHVRQGVHYGLNPNLEASRLVNGRELTSADIIFSLQRLCNEPRAYVKLSYPRLAAGTVFTAVDKYTVDIKMPPSEFADGMSQWFDRNHVIAPEVVQKYGSVVKWDLQVGTGPFLLTDYVESSSLTFAKNPNYWEKDPIGPGKGNQLPYVNGVKVLLITDSSTQQAALRTGQGRPADIRDAGRCPSSDEDDPGAPGKEIPGARDADYRHAPV
jgi:peptide/nickel transport system substrate-binding protein